MNTLVIGRGGREHAIVRALQKSSSSCYCFPGREGFNAPLFQSSQGSSAESLASEMKKKQIDLVIIGPEAELHQGWSDVFRSCGFSVFGPSRKASQMESSKIFSKKFMERARIPTARYHIVQSTEETLEKAKNFLPPYVLKANGLAAGKGVFICPHEKSLKENARKMFEKKIFGKAGEKALLEEFQEGRELSVFLLTNGEGYRVLPLAQDYKKLFEGGRGLNTGGMGSKAPIHIEPDVWRKIEENILKPTVTQMKEDSLFYRGVLYVGLILTSDEVKVLEYNVRFGDPECQAILPLLDMNIEKLFYDVAQGALPALKFNRLFSCCVVLAEKGYPEHIQKGRPLESFSGKENDYAYFLHAGTKKINEEFAAAGGRVLNAVGIGSSKEQARDRAYRLIHSFPHRLYFRKDIGL